MMNLEEVFHVVGGAGETSYASNSNLQESAIANAKFLVQQTIQDLYATLLPESLAVADLGCSSGPNTFLVISEIIDAVSKSCQRLCRSPPEILFFLNDLPGNDFNNIFRHLPSFKKKLKEERGETFVPFYVVGVPDSFYGRIFPKGSIHFMHSSYSVHWLSQVPEGLNIATNIHLNEENIYIAKTSHPSVFELYLEQFQRDFSKFLKARSEEIIYGGRMVLTILGRKNANPSNGEFCYLWGLLADALNNMVSKGIIHERKVHTFNLPYYTASIQEVKDVIQNEGSFDLEQEHIFEKNWDPFDDHIEGIVDDTIISGRNVANCIRAVTESLLVCHFGEQIIDELFSSFAENVARHLLKEKTKYVNFVISLKKRGKK